MISYPEHAIMPTDADEEMADAANNVIGREGPWKVVWSAMAEVAVKRATSSPDAAGSGGEAREAAQDFVERFKAALSQIGDDPSHALTYLSSKAEVAVRHIEKLLAPDATQTREAELRVFRALVGDLWGIESNDPKLVDLGEETIIAPIMSRPVAEAVCAALNARGGA